MRTENGRRVDLEALNELLTTADVLTIGFTLFPARMLVDTRTQGEEGPLVAIVAPVATVEDRYLWLGKHRGSFGAPQGFSFFIWPHMVRTLIATDALAPLRARLEQSSNGAAGVLDSVLQKIQAYENESIVAAIKGEDPWRSVWERAA